MSRCFEHRAASLIFTNTIIAMLLIVVALLGYSCMRDVQYFQNAPLVLRVFGMRRMPTASTISWQLSVIDVRSVELVERA
ncbi:hypothetical protein N9383_07040 [Granulosicoccus sp.]|nr:hypothetical protein [Granulosicoccus sp.]